MKKEENYFSSNLKYLREKNNYTLQQVADKSDNSLNAIRFWENGEREPNVLSAYNVACAFGISIDDMLLKNLRLEEKIELDKDHVLNNAILDKTKDLSEEDKKKIIDLIDLYKK